MKGKKRNIKKLVTMILVTLLVITIFSPVNTSANIGVVQDGIPINSTNDYLIDKFPGGYKYKARENWNVMVNGTKRGEMTLFVPPGEDSNLGRTMAHLSTVRQWGEVFNGNPQYVIDEMSNSATSIFRLNDQRNFQRYYSVEIARHSGARLQTRSGSGGTGYLEVTTTSFPTITKMQVPSTSIQNTDFDVTFSGIEYNPYASRMSYRILVNGSPKASGSLTASDLGAIDSPETNGSFTNRVEKIQISTPGTYQVELELTDAIARTTKRLSNTINITAKSTPPNGQPYLEIDPSIRAIKVGQETTYIANYYDKNGAKTVVTTNAATTWSVTSTSIGSLVSKGRFRGIAQGETKVRATYNGLTAEAILLVETEPPPPPPPEPQNEPPTVRIIGPTEVMVGEEFCLQADANDPDGDPLTYVWNYSGNGTLSNRDGCNLSYPTEGVKTVIVTVSDGKDSASASHVINVRPAQPKANFSVGGTLKENRHITLNPIHPYGSSTLNKVLEKYPMVEERWTITALEPNNQSFIRSVQNLNTNLNHLQVVDILMKRPGTYKVRRVVTNTLGLTDTVEVDVVVQPDAVPVADIALNTLVYRTETKKTAQEDSLATVKVSDMSYSRDDSIAKRIWSVVYDSNNDGIFDESPQILSDANLMDISFTTNKVGKYQIRLEVFEGFEQPTIAQFVDLSFDKQRTDRKHGNTDSKSVATTVVTVDNVAPNVSYDVQKEEVVNIQVGIGDTVYSEAQVENAFEGIREELASKGRQLKLNVEKTGIGTFESQPFTIEENYRIFFPPNVPGNEVFHQFGSPTFGPIIKYGKNHVIVTLMNGIYPVGYQVYGVDGPTSPPIANRNHIVFVNPYTNEFFLQSSNNTSPAVLDRYDFRGVKKGSAAFNLGGTQNGGFHIETLGYSYGRNYSFLNKDNLIITMPDYYNTQRVHVFNINDGSSIPSQANIYETTPRSINFTKSNRYIFIPNSSSDSLHVTGRFDQAGNNTIEKVIGVPSNKAFAYRGEFLDGLLMGLDYTNGASVYLKVYDQFGNLLLNERQPSASSGTQFTSASVLGDKIVLTSSPGDYRIYSSDLKLLKSGNSAVLNSGFATSGFAFMETIGEDTIVKKTGNGNSITVARFKGLGVETELPDAEPNGLNIYSTIVDTAIDTKDEQALDGLDDRFHHLIFGKEVNRTAATNIITKHGQGAFYINQSLTRLVQDVKAYIDAQYVSDTGFNELYITLEESVDYFTTYSDFEVDNKLTDRWRFVHTPSAFENNQGLDVRHNREMLQPITEFTRVGRYQPFYSAKDDPLNIRNNPFIEAIKPSFEEYRKWAKDAENWYIYVHRKPVPEFIFTIDKTSRAYTITNQAYDLDRQSVNIGYGGGIKRQQFHWRIKGEEAWTPGVPTSPLQQQVYEVRNTVEDFQGREESLIKELNATGINRPPIAAFDPQPKILTPREVTKLVNSSYDPDGDNLTARWYWKVKGASDSTYTEFATRAILNNNVPTPTWNPTMSFVNVGDYTFRLDVRDPSGLSSRAERDVTVKVDNLPPEITLTYSPSNLYEGDNVTLTARPTDVNNDPLTVIFEEQRNGTWVEIHRRTNVASGTNVTHTFKVSAKAYNIRARAIDPGGLQATAGVTFTPGVLLVEGIVEHTDEWREAHEKAGNAPHEFYSGEVFKTRAIVTSHPISSVTVRLFGQQENGAYTDMTSAMAGSHPVYLADVYNAAMTQPGTKLANGIVYFTFTATWQNGTVKTDIVPVEIIGDVFDAYQIHRTN